MKLPATPITKLTLLAACLLLGYTSVQAQQLAFPGAEGFGRFTSGGRGGAVYEVTNLNDTGAGSLRDAINKSGPRTIVFRVSGTITLQSQLPIKNGDLTIAGQTAPGDGICIKNNTVFVQANNVIIRYMRFRLGDESKVENDAIWGRNQENIILDHCSMSWSVDEVSSFYDNKNFTMQWCLLAESLYNSVHSKGAHGYGGIWGGQGATFHHNILADNSSRNPRFNGSRFSGVPEAEIVDFRNNVIFNWGGNSAYGGENGNQNMVANYYKSGPATTSSSKRYRIVDASAPSDAELGHWYVADNFVEGYPAVTADNWNGGVQQLSVAQLAVVKATEPFPFAPVRTQTAEEAYQSVLDSCGAILPKRDPVDARIINEIKTGTSEYGDSYGAKSGIIDSQTSVGGWPELASAPAPADTDHDGMPDEWEVKYHLNPNDSSDRNGDANNNGYTNLEEYLNGQPATDNVMGLKDAAQEYGVQVYPNPFAQQTSFRFTTKKAAQVKLQVLDVTGHVVATLDDKALAPGNYTWTWNGTDGNQRQQPTGLYLLVLQVGQERALSRVALVRD